MEAKKPLQIVLNKGPKTELGKLLEVIVQSIGAHDPRAFVEVDISKAIEQADAVCDV